MKRIATASVVAWSLVACNRDHCLSPGACGTDTGSTTDTAADTGTSQDSHDTQGSGDTDTGPTLQPAIYGDDQATFTLQHPVAWQPLSYQQQLYSGSLFDNTVTVEVTVGAVVSGHTDLSLTAGSNLDEVTPLGGNWQQYFTGVKDGGTLDASMQVNFPLTITINGTSFNLEGLISNAANLPHLQTDLPTYTFDTLMLEGDGDSAHYVASAVNYTWTSGELDPAYWAPYTTFDFDLDVAFDTTFSATKYTLYDHQDPFAIDAMTHAADRIDVSDFLGTVGNEPAQVLFDADAEGHLKNHLAITGTITITLRYNCCGSVSIPIDVPIDIGDDGEWGVKFQKATLTHDQQ